MVCRCCIRLMIGALILSVVWSASPAFSARHSFRNYTGDDGLSQLFVNCVAQDARGYVWIGTQAGLNRFDGADFEVLGLREGLRSDWIHCIVPDADGGVWIGTGGVWPGGRGVPASTTGWARGAPKDASIAPVNDQGLWDRDPGRTAPLP